jgi:hypothetical protein
MENMLWIVALIVVALSFSFGTQKLMQERTITIDSQATLSPDGAGWIETKRWYYYYGMSPMASSSLYTGKAFNITHWLDNRDRELPMSIAEVGENRQYTVQLIEPIMPGGEVHDTTTIYGQNIAKQEGDIWTYQGDPVYGYEKNNYLETITLPPGAEIISVEPKPNRQFFKNGSAIVVFQATRKGNEKFIHTIKYKLAK